ncbi:spike base protein, RCAP_Rcc01079 family [Rhizobium sp. 9140]|uniref:spike base protein, RCAP_Rcc01079 family n=1 Tax=Rhizobium sp. 9140 TaxID=1761900 RepID=UPI000B89AE89|nr:hypothetical protein [Rhizobium sp. 9140]
MNMADTISSPARTHFAIVPNDQADLAVTPKAIWCQADGTIVVRDHLGVDLPYAMKVGQILPLRAARILATGTSGTFYGLA